MTDNKYTCAVFGLANMEREHLEYLVTEGRITVVCLTQIHHKNLNEFELPQDGV
jgi:hypothetical protein